MAKPNLYELPVADGSAKKWCGGNLGGDNETCVVTTAIPGTDGYVVTDSKPEGAGHRLCMTTDELDSFAIEWASSRGLAL
ncbi:DUF397 domain-containing protein [Streptomyces sp. P17]|uniref:DUF397 domain-containing protein n=1 Tax=Streptomyces sp. P17 TaxID=3074716 RepID=UPI0028F435F1|nr:DUF397 domain-containing protein [Streptomyces sp. P17]MDT9695380.1 DUF397 domain-containing protein [Streptomyces sp. P17]